MILIITGSLSSGKDFVSNYMGKKYYYRIFDLDKIAHIILNRKENLCKIQNIFTKINNYQNDRLQILDQILQDQNKLTKLENIISSDLKKEYHKFVRHSFRQKRYNIIINIPLFFEKTWYSLYRKNNLYKYDKIISVITNDKIRKVRFINRAIKKDNHPNLHKLHQIWNFFLERQVNNLYRKKNSDYIIYNSLNKIESIKNIENLLIKLYK